MFNDGSIKSVLENMSRYMNAPQVLAEICATLANLTVHPSSAEYIFENHGCYLILKAMRRHMEQVDLQIQAFHAISGLGKLGGNVLAVENYVQLALDCLRKHKNVPELISAGWHALGSIANSGFIFGSIKQLLLPLLMKSMTQYRNNPNFLITACFGLSHIFFNNSLIILIIGETHVDDKLIAQFRVVELVLEILKDNEYNQSLHTTAIFALGSMVAKSEANRNIAYKNGGIHLIIKIMRMSSSRPKHGSLQISDLAFAVREPETEMYAPRTGKIQAAKPVLLQLFGSVALLNLSENGINV